MDRNTARENIIELKHISRTFDDGFRVVDDFNLTVQRGEFVTFLGPSGCGKTTTLRMIAGFDKPTEGELLLNGEDIRDLPPNKRPINTVFQRYALFPHLNVFENVAFGLKYSLIDIMVWQMDHFKAQLDRDREGMKSNGDQMLLEAFHTMLLMERDSQYYVNLMQTETGTDYVGKYL